MIILMACTTGTEPIVLDLKSLEQLPFVFGFNTITVIKCDICLYLMMKFTLFMYRVLSKYF